MNLIQSDLTFSQAIELLKDGKLVSREGWNGKEMFLMNNGNKSIPLENVNGEIITTEFLQSRECTSLEIQSHIDMWTAQNTLCVGWLASQGDMVANDWCEVEL